MLNMTKKYQLDDTNEYTIKDLVVITGINPNTIRKRLETSYQLKDITKPLKAVNTYCLGDKAYTIKELKELTKLSKTTLKKHLKFGKNILANININNQLKPIQTNALGIRVKALDIDIKEEGQIKLTFGKWSG